MLVNCLKQTCQALDRILHDRYHIINRPPFVVSIQSQNLLFWDSLQHKEHVKITLGNFLKYMGSHGSS